MQKGSSASAGMMASVRNKFGGKNNNEEGKDNVSESPSITTSNNSNRSSRMQKGSSASAGMMASARNIFGGNDSNNNNENDDRSRGGESVITNMTFNTIRTTTSLSIGILALLGKYPPDPEIQNYVKKIAVLKAKLIDYRRGTHRANIIEEQQRQRQLENSITQQKQVLVNKLLVKVHGCRYASGVTSNASYEKEIQDVVHKPYELELKDLQRKDPIDDLLDTCHFDYGYKPGYKPDTGSSDDDDDSCDEFCNDDEEYMDIDSSDKGGGGKDEDKKKKATKDSGSSKKDNDSKKFTIVHSTLIPLEVKLVRSQHNEVMTDHQMECVRSFQQREIEQLYELISQYQKEKKEELLSNTMQPKITELRDNNVALKNAYQAHMKAQEKMIALLREHVPPEHREPPSPSQLQREGEVNKNNDNHNNDV